MSLERFSLGAISCRAFKIFLANSSTLFKMMVDTWDSGTGGCIVGISDPNVGWV
jgi:hypothetical protein